MAQNGSETSSTDHDPLEQPLSAKAYMWISLVSFAITTALLFSFVFLSPRLVRDHLDQRFFYYLLIPLGLSAAAFVFGGMRSYARLVSNQVPKTVELGGPVVVAVLVVLGGFYLVPNLESVFNVTVRVQDASGLLLRGKTGDVTLYLGQDLRTAPIAANGEANFKEIPFKFRNEEIKLIAEVEGYTMATPESTFPLSTPVIYITLEGEKSNPISEQAKQLQQAERFIEASNYPAAQAIIEQLTKRYPDSPDAWLWQAILSLRLGNHAVSEAYADKALHLKPDFENGLATKIQAQLLRGGQHIERAARLAEENESISPRFKQWTECLSKERVFHLPFITPEDIEKLCLWTWA